MRFVFLSEGDLFLKEDGRDAVEVESHFAREALDRATTRSDRQAWKGQGRGEGGMFNAQTVWGGQAGRAQSDHPLIRTVARGPGDNQLLYTLAMSASSGLFRYDLVTREEQRLFHRHDFDGCGLSCHRPDNQLILSSRNQDHLGKLELYDEATRRRRQLTDGDSHDSNPSHDPRTPGTVYFQSSGVARNERGEVVALGPAAIQKLDCNSGDLTTLLEDQHWDYLQPRMDMNGALHFIRRPHDRNEVSPWHSIKAFVLLPFHLGAAVFGFLDAFSRMFAKRSLRPAGGGKEVPLARSRFATFQDTAIALEKVLDKNGAIDDRTQVVPGSWELVRLDADGRETVLAKHVVSYDLGANGELVYSDGLRIWQAGASPVKLYQGKIIQSVVIA